MSIKGKGRRKQDFAGKEVSASLDTNPASLKGKRRASRSEQQEQNTLEHILALTEFQPTSQRLLLKQIVSVRGGPR